MSGFQKLRATIAELRENATLYRQDICSESMANCYRCGRPILDTRYHLRRRVKTGGYERRRFSGGKATTVQTHYGMRIVCSHCARQIDFHENRQWLMGTVSVLVALIVMVVVLLSSR